MLNIKWIGFRRQVEQQVTRLFILFHNTTDTTFIDKPIDPSPVEILLSLSGTHRWLAPSIRLSSFVTRSSFVRRSSVCFLCPTSRPLYIKRWRPTSGSSADHHIWLFDPDESHQRECQWFLSRLSFIFIQTHTCATASSITEAFNTCRYR